MNREIKFKGWDTSNKKMLNPITQIWWFDRREGMKNTEYPIRIEWSEGKFGYWRDTQKDEIILLQFTGLKDKHNTEIYEGDIVQLNNSIRIFEFFNHCFWLIHPNRKFKFPIHMVTEDHLMSIEIIGNIYENNELINP